MDAFFGDSTKLTGGIFFFYPLISNRDDLSTDGRPVLPENVKLNAYPVAAVNSDLVIQLGKIAVTLYR
jgi:hypothetical protein